MYVGMTWSSQVKNSMGIFWKNFDFGNPPIFSAKSLKMFYCVYGNCSGGQSFYLTVRVHHFSESSGPQLSPDRWNFAVASKISSLEPFLWDVQIKSMVLRPDKEK